MLRLVSNLGCACFTASLAFGCAGTPQSAGESTAAGQELTFSFERGTPSDAAPDALLPAGFVAMNSGDDAPPARWYVSHTTDAPGMLVQDDMDATVGRFPMVVYQPLVARDVEVWVRFRAVRGRVDQAGGIAFRVQDARNYYVVRANALENNVRLYKVVNGVRVQLGGADVDVTPREWHRLGLSAHGSRLAVAFNGRSLFEVSDRAILAPGSVGLWTKADSVTFFDDLKIEAAGD